MQVVLHCSRAGLNFVQEKGDTIEVDAAEAGRMFASGQCHFVSDTDKPIALAAANVTDPSIPPTTNQDPPPARMDSIANADDDSDSINGNGDEESFVNKAKKKRATGG